MTRLVGAGVLAMTLACTSPAPRPIAYGTDQCAHCHMTLVDPRFAAELVTTTGKVLVFDDIGCMSRFIAGGTVAVGDIHSTWAQDYLAPGTFLRTSQLHFVRSTAFHTPMSSGIAAVLHPGSADSLSSATQGERLDWTQVLALAAPSH